MECTRRSTHLPLPEAGTDSPAEIRQELRISPSHSARSDLRPGVRPDRRIGMPVDSRICEGYQAQTGQFCTGHPGCIYQLWEAGFAAGTVQGVK